MAPLGAIEAEAKAVEVGLQFAKDLSIQDFTLEIDSQVLINALTETSPAPASGAAIVHSVIVDSHSFCRVDFSHVLRQGNRSTHFTSETCFRHC